MHSVSAVELHVSVNYIEILSVTQQCYHGKVVNINNANFTYQFFKEIILNLHSNVTHKCYSEAKECLLAYGLL